MGGPSDGRAGLGSAADMTTLWTLVPTSQVCAGGGDLVGWQYHGELASLVRSINCVCDGRGGRSRSLAPVANRWATENVENGDRGGLAARRRRGSRRSWKLDRETLFCGAEAKSWLVRHMTGYCLLSCQREAEEAPAPTQDGCEHGSDQKRAGIAYHSSSSGTESKRRAARQRAVDLQRAATAGGPAGRGSTS